MKIVLKTGQYMDYICKIRKREANFYTQELIMQINQSTLIQTQITMLERSIAELNKRLALLEVKQDIIQDDVNELFEQEIDCVSFYGSVKSGR